MADPEGLDRLTPRERDVYEVWKAHPDWSNAQIGFEVKFPAPHVVRALQAEHQGEGRSDGREPT